MYSLFEFDDEAQIALFNPINDGVMGGVSQSALVLSDDKTATFLGSVSLENNGGFASIRASLDCADLSDYNGIVLRLRGDGKRYKLRLTNSAVFDTVVYESTFVSPKEYWSVVRIPFSSLKPKWRGKLIEGAPEFDKKRVSGLGLMISEKQAGEFVLRLDWIRTYR